MVEAESALRARYDQEVAGLVAPKGRWTISQRDDRSDTFSPDRDTVSTTDSLLLPWRGVMWRTLPDVRDAVRSALAVRSACVPDGSVVM